MRTSLKYAVSTAAAMLFGLSLCNAGKPVVIYQVSDPQLGFTAKNKNMDYEIATMLKAVERINATSPDVVVFTGDLVHNCKDDAQWAEFKRLTGEINPEIPRYCIPGNHDIVSKTEKFDMGPYTSHMGEDRFCAEIGKVLLVGMNTDYLKYTEGTAEEAAQVEWLRETLADKEKSGISIVFGHHPFFLDKADEPEEYFNIRPDKRKIYMDLFKEAGVTAVFCGHKHDNYVTADGDMPVVTTSAIGKQLGNAESGIRIIVCHKGKVWHSYLTPEEIPDGRKAVIRKVLGK